MRLNFYFFIVFFFLGLFTINAQTTSILIDFGGSSSATPWNNVSNASSGSLNNLTNSFGISTNIAIQVVDSFNGVNSSGTQSADPSLNIPGSASGDSFFGNTVLFSGQIQPTGGIQLSNLDTSKLYTLKIFASRLTSDNRETKYVVSGAVTDSAYLDVTNNTDSIVVISTKPKVNGTIDLVASPGPNNNNSNGFFYLGALIVEYASDSVVTPSLSLTEPNGGEFWQVGKIAEILWQNTTQQSVILEYSTNGGSSWNTIDTVSAFQFSYDWTIPNTPSTNCFVRISSDSLSDQNTVPFEISADSASCTIVVLGSSTAAGSGASTADSAWVNRYRNEITQNDTRYSVINLARGGYTTYHLLPDGDPHADTVGITIDTTRNVTEALIYNPSAIIINLPSNDASNYFSVADQLVNFNIIVNEAKQQGIKVWVCTTQPKNFSDSTRIQIQTDMRDSIFSIYGDYALDFWNGLADSNAHILPQYNSGDGTHLNDAGHRLLFEKVLAKNITDSACGFTPIVSNEFFVTETESFTVYPNPFQSTISFKMESEFELVEIALYDICGKMIFMKQNFPIESKKTWEITPNLTNNLSTQILFLKVKASQNDKLFEKTIPLIFQP